MVDGRLLGIDFGTKKIGLAMTDPEQIMALPKEVVQYSKIESAIEKIITTIKEYDIAGVIIGNPLNMDDSESAMSKAVYKFANKLKKKINTKIFLADERLSSFKADDILLSSGVKNSKKNNKKIDAIAAQIILTSVIENKVVAIPYETA